MRHHHRRRRLPAIVFPLVLAISAAGCGGEQVPIASGDGPNGPWVAVLHRMDNGLLPDDRVCVRVSFSNHAVDSGCGASVGPSGSMEITSGVVIASSFAAGAVSARFTGPDGETIETPLAPGAPLSGAQWVVFQPLGDPMRADGTGVVITFLDADGNSVETIDTGL